MTFPQPISPGYAARWEMARDFGSVRRDERPSGRVYWYVDVRADGRRFKIRRIPVHGGGSIRIGSEEQAQEVLGAIRDALRNQKTPLQAIAPWLGESSALAFSRSWDRFLAAKRTQGTHARQLSAKRLAELEAYRRRGYLEPLEAVPIHMLSYGLLEDWIGWLFARRPALAPKSIANVVHDVGTCLRWLVRRGDLAAAPELPPIRVPDHAPRIPTAETQARILEAIPWRERGLFLARGLMGLRPSEARRARVADWDPDAETLAVMGKGDRYRILPVHDQVAGWIREHVDPRGALAGALLFTRAGGRPWSDSSQRRAWIRACKAVGAVDGAGRHLFPPNEGMRHCWGTEAVNRGVGLDVVGKVLGHTSEKTTRRYARLSTAGLVGVIRREA